MKRIIFLALTCTLTAFAQRGDRGKQAQPEVWRDMDVPPAPALAPEAALKTFHLPEGFRIELVAAEPMIENPVEVRWDGDGRVWVVEMRAYMPTVDGKGEDERNGRVSVLEDTNGDGRMDKRTIFLDGLQMPRALALVQGGVLVAEPPTLWYCRDTDGDLICDEKEAVAKYGKQGPVEHTENGLLPAMDNWMYNAKSSRRFKFNDGQLIDEKVNGKGQWGIVQDNYGRLYYNSNSSYLHVDQVPGHYFYRNNRSSKGFGLGVRVHNTSEVFSSRVNPGINRGYQGNMLRADGRLRTTTAVCGPTIYRGDQFPPEFVGDAFIPEPSGNAVAHFRLTSNGYEVKGEHQTYPHTKYEKVEFLTSTDERFRPVNSYTGPDGCLYILDMYHGILQHKVYVTTYLRKQIIERGLDKDNMRGRLYRIVHKAKNTRPPPQLERASTKERIRHLMHANGVVRDTAQRLLVQDKDPNTRALLESVDPTVHKNHLFMIHALWTLDGLGEMSMKLLETALAHPHPAVRIHALRVSESQLEDLRLLQPIFRDTDPNVLIQLAFSLGAFAHRPEGRHLMLTLLAQHGKERHLMDAALSGLAGHEALMLVTLQEDPLWQEASTATSLFQRLAGSMFLSGRPDQIEILLSSAASETRPWAKAALLEGISKYAGKSKPISLPTKPAALDLLEGHPALAGALKYITWKGDTRAQHTPKTLSPQDQKLFDVGKVHYAASCMACHQQNGQGLPAVSPTLVQTPWVNGSEERLVRIVLNGLMGVIEVEGEEWNLVMPPHRDHPTLDDEKIAGILTYVRNSFGNEASAVQPETVRRVREATDARLMPWTVKELNALK